ncbi:MAG: hypothetical protein ABS37_16280 [Acidovorax sp. SCN 65-108]|nr:MAG: hypothetical protein ABS37_16280 [Acidovorax sp. SCN 65-108]OJV73066.1 MAG: hypothetical protein BGO35_12010 [Burkholderiales bacterium 64-34]
MKALFDVAAHSAQPLNGMRQWLPQPPSRESGGRTLVLGVGEFCLGLAQALQACALTTTWRATTPVGFCGARRPAGHRPHAHQCE